MTDETLGVGGVALRFAFALLLVLLTFNPTGHSYYHWLAADFPTIDAVKAFAGIVLLIGWVVFLTATARSLGVVGVLLALAFFAALVWVAVQFGWLDAGNTRALVWIGLVVAAAILAMGVSWSHIRRRLTGQADVDEVDTR
ncbi:MAG: hypothetical protein CMLOHMNK_02718 [Steroidobacteraceae bacterium]|nr:hypothetical protein [Steroidobacteraceae bacterium]